MKKLLGLVLVFLFWIISSNGQTSKEALVKKAFDDYKAAILNDKGEEAVKYVDSRTIKYYTEIIDLVKNADSARVDSLSLMDKITVFSIRHRASREEILDMDGTDIFVYAIKKGMVGKNSVANNSIGKITIDGNFARGQLLANGKAAPIYFHFYNEMEQWKLDLTSLFPISNAAFRNMIKESGEKENEFLFTILESLTGKKPGVEIWQKVK